MKNTNFDLSNRTHGNLRCLLLAALLSPMFPDRLHADGPAAPPVLEFTSGLPGKQVRLTWAAQPGLRYRVEKSTNLGAAGADGWSQVALMEASGASAVWLDPEPTVKKAFYRVAQPQAEVFAISPPLLSSSGGTLVIRGQRIPEGSVLVIQIPGQAPILVPLSAMGNGDWQAVVSGTFDPGVEMLAISIVDTNGVPIVTLSEPIEITLTGLAADSPPSLPPAAPVSEGRRLAVHNLGSSGNDGVGVSYLGSSGQDGQEPMKRGNWLARMAGGGGDDDCDGFDSPQPLGMAIKTKGTGAAHNFADDQSSALIAFWLSKKGYDYYQAQSSMASASSQKKGYDYYKAMSDMGSAGTVNNPYFNENQNAGEIPELSRGHKWPDLMKREMGPGAISPAPSGLPGEVSFQFCALSLETPAGPPLEMIHTYRSKGGHSGGTAAAHWECCYDISVEPIPLAAGSSATRVIVNDGGGRADVFYRQADGTYRCDGMFREGRFDGDAFTLTFADKGTWTFNPLSSASAAGKIAAIADCHQHSLTCAYDGAGQLEMVSSAFGQRLVLSRGSDGSLSSVADQTGRFVSYSYYGPQDPDGSPGDLKAISTPRLTLVPSVPSTVFTYSTGQKVPALNGNLLSITDSAGHLLEAFTYAGTGNPADIDFDTCDSHNRYTGHVTLNRREINPTTGGYTVFEVDEIGRLTETDFDRQHREVAVREFTGFCTPDVPVTSQSNRPTGKLHASDPDFFETTCAYNADSRCTRITEADGSQELTTYDRDFRKDCPVRERGNARVMTLRAPGGEMRTVTCDYLPDFGTPECFRPGNPIGGLSVKGGKGSGNIVAQGRKGWDGSVKGNIRKGWDGSVKGNRKGWDGSIKGNLAREEGGRHTPFHNKRTSAGSVAGIAGGAIAGIVIGAIVALEPEDDDCDGFVADRKGWDGTIKGNGRVTRMVSAYGQVSTFGYNANGDCTSATSPVSGRGSLYSYNSNGQLTSSTVLNGASPAFTDECVYDAATGFLSSVVSDPAGLHISTSFERDNLGLVTRVIDPLGNDWLYQYNALDQCVQIQSPSMPNRISMNFTTDASGRVCRCDVEHRAPDGSLVSANPVYSTFFVRDDRANLIQVASEERPVNSPPAALAPATADLASYDVCDITLDNAGQVTRLSTPAACREQAADRTCDFTYNERGLLDRCVEGGLGTAGAVTTEYAYDSVRAVVRCSLVVSGIPSPQSLCTYDGFHRLSSVTDPMGNVTEYAYGNDGSVTTSVYGEVNDQPGSANNTLLSRSTVRVSYQDLPGNPTGASCLVLPGLGHACYDLDVKSSAFFTVETEDDTVTVERFSPGDATAHATEVTVVDRSPAGLVQSVTCNGDPLLSCNYDTAGRGVRCADGTCSVVATLDACGNVVSSERTDISGVNGVASKTFTTSNFRDPFGRVTSCTDGSGNVCSIAYDSLSRPVSITEPGRPPVLYAYDGATETADGTAGAPFSVQVSCDISSTGSPAVLSSCLVRSGECRSTTNADGQSTGFTRDALGRAVRCDRADGTHDETEFDSLGRPVSHVYQDGSVANHGFDLNGRLTSTSWPGSTSVAPTSLAYDGLGRVITCGQGMYSSAMTYDSCGNPVRETAASGTVTRAVARSFNHRGRTGITYPDGRHFNESRDALGQLLAITNSTGGNVVTMGYAGHRVIRSAHGNGVVTTWTYRGDTDIIQGDFSFDECVRSTVSSPSSVVLSDERVFRDRSQQPTRCETRFAAGADATYRSKAFTLDGLGRTTTCVTERRETTGGQVIPESSVSYVLGAEGRRISEIRNTVAGNYTQSADAPPSDFQMGQYTTWPGSTLPLVWDDNGNLARMTRGATKLDFVHNDAGQLVTVNDTSGTTAVPVITYAYDALGRRASRTTLGTPSVATTFVYDGAECIQELGADGFADMTFVSSGGVKQCISTRNGTIFYPHGVGSPSSCGLVVGHEECDDGNPDPGDGCTSLITSATGAPVERFDCDDACKPVFLTADGVPTSSTSSSIGLRWLSPACAWEPEIGMFACPSGIYSPDLGSPVSYQKAPGKSVKKELTNIY